MLTESPGCISDIDLYAHHHGTPHLGRQYMVSPMKGSWMYQSDEMAQLPGLPAADYLDSFSLNPRKRKNPFDQSYITLLT